MPRRHSPPESAHAHRWMVSYADFMTLMFAFFVVLYSASSLNDEKFNQMSQVFVGVFDQPVALNLSPDVQSIITQLTAPSDQKNESLSESDSLIEDMALLQVDLNRLIEQSLDKPRVSLQKVPHYLQLEVPADYLFKGNSATVSVEGAFILAQLADAFEGISNFISIEVFTDNQVPEVNPWQLAANQGMAILQLLTLDDVSPMRLAVINYGPFQPIATNDDDEGQSINRRVLFLIHDNKGSINRVKTVTDAHLSANP